MVKDMKKISDAANKIDLDIANLSYENAYWHRKSK